MLVKWNKSAIKQLLNAIQFIEEQDFLLYAKELEANILLKIKALPQNPTVYPLDKYKRNNNGTYRAFEVEHYRITYRSNQKEIRILRVRHTSRRIKNY